MEEHLTPDEMARKLKVKPTAIRQWLKTGALRGIKIGRIWRIPVAEAQRFLQVNAEP